MSYLGSDVEVNLRDLPAYKLENLDLEKAETAEVVEPVSTLGI